MKAPVRRPEAVLLIGLPGAGKSSFYVQRYFRTHVRISLDMLRTRHREQALVRACLAARQSFVVDNTNVTPEDRARYILPAREAGFEVAGCFFEPDVDGCLRRNRLRAGSARVPDAAIRGSRARLRLPAPAEGFDRLLRVTLAEAAEGSFVVTGWPGQP